MRPFTVLTGPATVLLTKNIDADTILPAPYLTEPTREWLGAEAVGTCRFGGDGSAPTRSPLSRATARMAPIVIAGENFGYGPSRERAAWALNDLGVRVIVSPRFADRFADHAFKIGLLLIELPQSAIDSMVAAGVENVAIDLAAQTVSTPGWGSVVFEIDPVRKAGLLGRVANVSLDSRA